MKRKALRIPAALLALALLITLLPTAAPASGESGILLGTSGIGVDDGVYLGDYTEGGTTYDVPWLVLSAGSGEAFLLSKYLLGTSPFREEYGGYYKDGALNRKMEDFYNGAGTLFTSAERVAIIEKTNLSCGSGPEIDTASPVIDSAHLYPLSLDEVRSQRYAYNRLFAAPYITEQAGSNERWWLRTSRAISYPYYMKETGDDEHSDNGPVDTFGVRPALNIDMDAVLFTSAATGGKASGTVGAGALNTNLPPSGATSWKLTLKDYDNHAETDGDRDGFRVYTSAVSGRSFSFRYSGAKTGAGEYLSAMIVDNGSVTYYGRILRLDGTTNAASGTAAVNVPGSVTLDNDTILYVFNEQYNGDKNTDYASALKQASLTVEAPAAAVGSMTVSGTTGTAIAQKDVTLTLTNETFNAIAVNEDVLTWFTNLPGNLSAKIKTAVVAGADAATITISGTPAEASAAAMAITIPATALACGAPVTAAANLNARYDIALPAVSTPAFTPAGGTYTAEQNVTITCATSGATIRYTTDGTDPTTASTPYTAGAPIAVAATSTIKAKAFKSGMADSTVASATYTINLSPVHVPITVSSVPVFPQGNAPELVVTIGAGIAGFNATNNFDGIDSTSHLTPALGSVGVPGADGKVEDGSIQLTLYRSYLNTLAPGAYGLRVRLKGGMGLPAYVETRIVVTAPGSADAPKTGDGSAPLIWIGLMLLAGAGLCISAVRRRKSGAATK